jgi:hypothetical protein
MSRTVVEAHADDVEAVSAAAARGVYSSPRRLRAHRVGPSAAGLTPRTPGRARSAQPVRRRPRAGGGGEAAERSPSSALVCSRWLVRICLATSSSWNMRGSFTL